ncbi:acetamidase/formamidase family protein [Roseospira goensis]|uniref:Acetamidase/formamidase n=1 Tax=Roseospira goensis TaxID=391922 RepID=A0A7W6WK48_9PROT|nr:acetamidase/formamidase family protein [Roseospira goensis]MBB4285193.1 acetamidase/formamidase [Roseospira goensis]
MCNNAPAYTIHGVHHHCGWDRALAPVRTVSPGTTLEFECLDASGGQLTRTSTVADVPNLDFGRINPVTGPVYVDGAEPGDALKVTIESFRPSGFGWTANIPGFGLLADQFETPGLHLWSYEADSLAPALFSKVAKVPLKPFAGTIGLAPAAPGPHSVVPPRNVGGNMDIRDLAAGTTLWLPVEVAGALFSIGDTHAAQGDGEVCGTAIESPMNVVVTLEVEKGAAPKMPRFSTPGPVTRHLDAAGYEVTTGVGPDLLEGARAALSQMVDWLARTQGMDPLDAYMLCSVCGDLRISEIVDQPNWVVSFYFPRVVLS